MRLSVGFVVVLVLLGAGSSAHAGGGGYLAVSPDFPMVSCSTPGATFLQLFVVHYHNPGATSVEFRAPIPDCIGGAVVVGVMSQFNYSGDFQTGVTVD